MGDESDFPPVVIASGLHELSLVCTACAQRQVWALPDEAMVRDVLAELRCCRCHGKGFLVWNLASE